jgi:hypothetical protein
MVLIKPETAMDFNASSWVLSGTLGRIALHFFQGMGQGRLYE